MIGKIEVSGKEIEYDLQYKKVKNINLRIKADGSVCVSASRKVPQSVIDDFIILKADFIFCAISKMQEKSSLPKIQHYTESELKVCLKKMRKFVIHHIFYTLCVGIHQICVKCQYAFPGMTAAPPRHHFAKPYQRIFYAFCRIIGIYPFTNQHYPNHSSKFYDELTKACPKWKEYRNRLKEVNIR